MGAGGVAAAAKIGAAAMHRPNMREVRVVADMRASAMRRSQRYRSRAFGWHSRRGAIARLAATRSRRRYADFSRSLAWLSLL